MQKESRFFFLKGIGLKDPIFEKGLRVARIALKILFFPKSLHLLLSKLTPGKWQGPNICIYLGYH